MRYIHVDEGLRLRFPARDEEFAAGVEIGMLTVLMDLGLQAEFSRWIASSNVEQARSVAEKLGYRLVAGQSDGGWTHATFRFGKAPPKLEIVRSAG